ncbi:hypothetical protein GOZ78_02205 [Agrobacterium vitis]|uniref:GDYXXLXY domain-containing protein n=1 Tax=Agrobacterium vitis TaxID=373 RepID=A0ABD6GE65_AGRVI|nr:GDYXXLXY domain-containing protein [Agrobacterium vitis]MUO77708.1 hypothetical protein [Agrobacterium vitis]MUO93225.1 hypothetical protein [Agrobacterium vitis]MUP04576.1 hypothetical protein [Agrobacterium vitis]MUZ80987.1 hypothetical protein [Agrobacterium vitis]MVA08828.1 hypothetical protein [Agrobacterium vitis]
MMQRNHIFRLVSAAILLAALQTAAIGYQIGERANILRNGQEVLLRTEAVDPRDLLRGDFVVLNYPISRIPEEKIVGPRPSRRQDVRLHVRVVPQADGFATVEEASVADLLPRPGSVVLLSEPLSFPSPLAPGDSLTVHYGIERFYVPEGEGRDIEAQRNQGAVSIAIRVSSAGRAQIRQLFVAGQPVYREPDF